MFIRNGFVPDQKEVLIVPLHQVFFTGIFLQEGGLGFQLFEFLFRGSDLLLIILLALFQLHQLPSFPEMAGNKVPGIEEEDPERESQCRQQVFIL